LAETVAYEEEKSPTILQTLFQEKPSHYIVAFFAASLSVSLSLYHLFISYAGTVEAHAFRSTHLAFVLVIAFLIRPLGRKSSF
jgi:TRAP-type uncharacterized transport system fused permease subunit